MGLRSAARTGGAADARRRSRVDGALRRLPWGWVDAAPTDRSGVCIRYRLRILPPGTTVSQRRLLVALRRLPIASVAAAVLLTAFAVSAGVAGIALVAAGVAFAGLFAMLLVTTRETRRRTVTIYATRFCVGGQEEVYGDLPFIVRCVATLTAADRALRAGEIDPVRHEAVWWRVYDEAGEVAHSLDE